MLHKTIECRSQTPEFYNDPSQDFPVKLADFPCINEWYESQDDEYKSELLMRISEATLVKLATGLFHSDIDATSEVGDAIYRIVKSDYDREAGNE